MITVSINVSIIIIVIVMISYMYNIISGTYISVISQNQELFKTFILDAVVRNANVSPIRVSHIQVRRI